MVHLMENKLQFECISPNTGKTFDKWVETSVSEFNDSLNRLYSKSFAELLPTSSRTEALKMLSDAIEEGREELETLIVAEVGKTKAEANADQSVDIEKTHTKTGIKIKRISVSATGTFKIIIIFYFST